MLETLLSGTDLTLAAARAFAPLRAVSEGVADSASRPAAHAPGLPQLDFAFWPGHIFWTLVTFAVLYWAFERHLLPGIEAPIRARRARIEADLAGAEKLKSEIDAARARADAAIGEARARGQKAAQSAQAEMAAEAQARRSLAETQLASRIAETEAVIAKAEAEALGTLGTLAPDLARDIVARVSGLQLSHDEIAQSFAACQQARASDRG